MTALTVADLVARGCVTCRTGLPVVFDIHDGMPRARCRPCANGRPRPTYQPSGIATYPLDAPAPRLTASDFEPRRRRREWGRR